MTVFAPADGEYFPFLNWIRFSRSAEDPLTQAIDLPGSRLHVTLFSAYASFRDRHPQQRHHACLPSSPWSPIHPSLRLRH
jgi:hypothetical protein